MNTHSYKRKNNLKFNMKKFFSGKVEGWGILFDIFGRQKRNFYVSIEGKWSKNQGSLDEKFTFDDGEESTRKWEVEYKDNQAIKASASDVIGIAEGREADNTLNLKYILEIPYKGKKLRLDMDDWMYLTKGDAIINRTSMKKFGIKVGELVLCMRKKK